MTPRTKKPRPDIYRTTVMKDTHPPYPELWLEVFIQADRGEYPLFVDMFLRARCLRADTPDQADLVIFGGGVDVDPMLYGEKGHNSTHFSVKRDEEDIALYEKCLELGVPMFGVCRGAQFLHVMNGGKLWQDVNNHVGDHEMWDPINKQAITVSSVHHQMCVSNRLGGMDLLGTSQMSTKRVGPDPETVATGLCQEVEAFFYRDTASFGVQGHPEYKGYGNFTAWTLKQIQELICSNPDMEVVGRNRRLKKSFIHERNERADTKAKALN